MDRRRLLRGASAAMLTLPHCCWAWPVDGARHEDPRLVVVFLRGAYDALSVVVPHAEPFYREARPTIAIPAPDASPGGALQLDARWALHPSLDALMPLWEDRQMSFIPFAGTEFVSRSHFDAQDRIECGLPPGYRVDVASGFLGRLRDVLGSRRAGPRVAAVGFASSGPLALRGVIPAATVSPAATPDSAMTASHIERVLAMYRGNPLAPLAREGLAWQAMVREAVREDLLASRGAPLAPGFAREAERVGRLLREQPEYRVAMIDVGGWDTHAQQGGVAGALATRLRALGDGLASMQQALGDTEWRRTVVVVLSEFGRTFRENGTRGTDHGHGTTLWVAGGAVRGGAIRGEQADLTGRALHQGRDVPVLNEYRSVLAGLVQRLYGLSSNETATVFPGAAARDVGLL